MGRMLLEQGKISAEDAERILRLQKEKKLRFGDAALELGLITPADVQQILAAQFRYPYLQPEIGNFSKDLVAAYEPFSEKVETLRALRSELILRWFSSGQKSLAIFGVDMDEGVSLLAANLAIVFSQLGESTLLVDANLRTPTQHDLFNLGQRSGLSDVLADRAGMETACRIESFVSLSVLTAGTQAPNPQELLGRPQFSALTSTVALTYDVVLFTAPALGTAVDALAVAARAGGVLLVGNRNKTQLANIRIAGEKLRGCGAEIVGTVIVDE
jgi:chain length determinant protein tyrosine kinase EpsG